MAIAKKCDICGKLYELYNVRCDSEKVNGLMFLNLDSKNQYFTHNTIDCCPECMKSIQDHIDSLKGEKND